VVIYIRRRERVGFGGTGGEDERKRGIERTRGGTGGIRGRREDGGRRKYRRRGKRLCECFAVSAPVAVNRNKKNRSELTINH